MGRILCPNYQFLKRTQYNEVNMGFFDYFKRNRQANEALAATIHANTAQLGEVVDALKNRESPDTIRNAVCRGLKEGGLEQALVSASNQVASLNSSLQHSGARPIPVQTFPITDDFQFEKEKQLAAHTSAKLFVDIGNKFIERFSQADKPVGRSLAKFFSMIDDHIKAPGKDNESLKRAMEDFLQCSPKNVIAEFQKQSLEAGIAIVQKFNLLIDQLAKEYPRCRSGIFASRLNYSDAVQISEEVLSTLRTTSTMLDDVQRRHDLLEALQGEVVGDLHSKEIQMIWNAVCESMKDSFNWADKQDGFFTSMLKTAAGVASTPISLAMAALLAPSAQFQGVLARQHRMKVFVATSVLLKLGWEKWSRSNQEIVIPNLKAMFALKCDFVQNRIITISDLISINGYSLDQLPKKIETVLI